MDLNQTTQKVQEAVQAAQALALRYGHHEVDGEHLLAALLDQSDGLTPRLFGTPGRRRAGAEGAHRAGVGINVRASAAAAREQAQAPS